MPTQARHFGVKANATAQNISGYTDHGILLVQNAAGAAPAYGQAGDTPDVDGCIWQMGPDEDRQDWGENPSIIAYTKAAINDDSAGFLNTEGTIGDPGYEPGDGSDQSGYAYNGAGRKIAFKMCATADFLSVAQDLVPLENFSTESDAVNYFNNTSESAWTNHVASGESGEPKDVATTQAPEPTLATTQATLATTQAPEPTLATTRREGGGDELTYEYYVVHGCGAEEPQFILRTPGGSNLKAGFAYDATNIIANPEWNNEKYVVVSTNANVNYDLVDNNPTGTICEA